MLSGFKLFDVDLLKLHMILNRHQTKSFLLLVVDEEGKIWNACPLVFAFVFIAVAIELSWLTLFLGVVLLFVDKYRFLLLWQLNGRSFGGSS